MRILVLGASGMAGHVVYRWLKERGHQMISHVYRTPLDEDSVILDLFKKTDRLDRLIESRSPDTIVNCVGLLPAECDCRPDKAAYLNAYLPQHLATRGVRVIHISTDCVFSGEMGSYKEGAVKDAQTIYGITKSAGELNDNRNLTIRTSIVGPEVKVGSGLLDWFLRQEVGVQGWANAFWNGVTTLELAQFIEYAIEKDVVGLCHLHAEAPVSKFQLLKDFRQIYGEPNVQISARVLEKPIDKTLVTTREDIDWMRTEIRAQLYALQAWYDKKVPDGLDVR